VVAIFEVVPASGPGVLVTVTVPLLSVIHVLLFFQCFALVSPSLTTSSTNDYDSQLESSIDSIFKSRLNLNKPIRS
jgi:hypothetical protein